MVNGKPVPLLEVITGPDAVAARSAQDLADAMKAALRGLPPLALAIAEALKSGNVSDVSGELGISRRQVYGAMTLIRAALIAAGVDLKEK